MNETKISLEYTNSVMCELEKAFWDERGKGARFRTTKIGQKFFKEKCLPVIKSNDLDEIIWTIQGILEQNGIVDRVISDREERLLRIKIEGCIHRDVEESLREFKVEPFTCIPANMIVLAIEEKLELPAELAEIKLEDGACQLLVVVFEKHHTLD